MLRWIKPEARQNWLNPTTQWLIRPQSKNPPSYNQNLCKKTVKRKKRMRALKRIKQTKRNQFTMELKKKLMMKKLSMINLM